MSRSVTGGTFDFFSQINQFLKLVLAVILLQIDDINHGFFQGVAKGNEFGNFIRVAIRHAQHPADVPDCPPGFHGAESNDLSDFILTVFFGDVFDHFIAPIIGKIQINIRRAGALGI